VFHVLLKGFHNSIETRTLIAVVQGRIFFLKSQCNLDNTSQLAKAPTPNESMNANLAFVYPADYNGSYGSP